MVFLGLKLIYILAYAQVTLNSSSLKNLVGWLEWE